jgi:hypothetical protein
MPIFLNSNADATVGQGPWQSDYKLLINVCYLFESPKVALNFSTNASKSFNNGIRLWCKIVFQNDQQIQNNGALLLFLPLWGLNSKKLLWRFPFTHQLRKLLKRLLK